MDCTFGITSENSLPNTRSQRLLKSWPYEKKYYAIFVEKIESHIVN